MIGQSVKAVQPVSASGNELLFSIDTIAVELAEVENSNATVDRAGELGCSERDEKDRL